MKELFTEQEWELLKLTSAIVFKMVAHADKKIDNKELEAFSTFCNSRNNFKSKLFKLLLPANPQEYLEETLPQIDKTKIKDLLREVDVTLDLKISPSDSKSFKHHLIALGVYVANSSGKLFQHNISDEEDEMIMKFAKSIDIDASQLFKTTLIDEIIKNI